MTNELKLGSLALKDFSGDTVLKSYKDPGISVEDHLNKIMTKQRRAQEELLYDNLEETAPIPVSNGRVTFCCHIKYLGSYFSFCLCDDYDIDKRIAAASLG